MRSKFFDKVSTSIILSWKKHGSVPLKGPAEYSDDYRHFDALIWQLPALTTGLFGLFVSSLDDISDEYKTLFLFVALIFFVLCYLILYRWRLHQKYTVRQNAPMPFWGFLGAQFFLQIITITFPSFIIYLLIKPCQKLLTIFLVVLGVAILISTVLVECNLRIHLKYAKQLQEEEKARLSKKLTDPEKFNKEEKDQAQALIEAVKERQEAELKFEEDRRKAEELKRRKRKEKK